MIRVDPSVGSADLLPYFQRSGVPAMLSPMPFGDVAFEMRGPDERPILVGVEVKRVEDLLACIRDGRLSGHQLPGLQQGFEHAILLIEGGMQMGVEEVRPGVRSLMTRIFGQWRASSHSGAWAYYDAMSYLHTVQMRTGIQVVQTSDRLATVQWISSLYHWGTSKAWEQHDSCIGLHEGMDDDLRQNQVALIRPTRRMMVASKLPGIGAKKSYYVARHFPSISAMIAAPWEKWLLPSQVGEKGARTIVDAIMEKTPW